MITILTGEDIVSSRNKLNELLSGKKNVIHLDGKKSSVAEIEMAFESNSLFEEQKVIVVEHFGKVKPPEKIIEILKRGSPDQIGVQDDKNIEVILWDEADLSVKFKNALKTAKTFSFVFPKVYFAFLDGLLPTSSTQSINLLHQALKSYAPEQILYSILKRIRQLLILKSNNYLEFAEFAKMQSWQLSKLKQQADMWTEDGLKNAYLSYGELDEKVKTSALTMDLSSHLDIILLQD